MSDVLSKEERACVESLRATPGCARLIRIIDVLAPKPEPERISQLPAYWRSEDAAGLCDVVRCAAMLELQLEAWRERVVSCEQSIVGILRNAKGDADAAKKMMDLFLNAHQVTGV